MKNENNTNLNEPARMSRAVRPTTVRDTAGRGHNRFTPGKAPIGGFTAVWDFSGRSGDLKNSPTGKPEK